MTRESWEQSNSHNPPISVETTLRALIRFCDKTAGNDGNTNAPIQIWKVRRAVQHLLQFMDTESERDFYRDMWEEDHAEELAPRRERMKQWAESFRKAARKVGQ